MTNVKHYKKVPVLPEGYTECEYLESSGTQYILIPFYNQGTGEFLYKIAEKPTMKLVPMVQMYHKGVPYFKDKGKAKLPENYTQLQYIQSTGSEWIDTGFTLSSFRGKATPKIEMDILFPTTQTGREYCISGWSDNPQVGIKTGNPARWQNYNTGTEYVYANILYHTSLDLSGAKSVLNVDGYTPVVGSANTSWNNETFRICGFTGNAQYGFNARQQVYSCKIYQDGLVANYIPCKTSSGEVGMYDTVSNRFFGNNGYGSFIAGPEAPVDTEENNVGIVGLYSKGDIVRNIPEPKPQDWMINVANEYCIPVNKLIYAYTEYKGVKEAFIPNEEGKYRYVQKTSDNIYIDTEYIPNSDTEIKTNVWCASGAGIYDTYVIIGANTTDGCYNISPHIIFNQGGVHVHTPGNPTYIKFNLTNVRNTIYAYFGGYVVNGETYTENSSQLTYRYPFYIFGQSGASGHLAGGNNFNLYKIGVVSIIENGNAARCYVPFVRNGVDGVLDLITNQFYSDGYVCSLD